MPIGKPQQASGQSRADKKLVVGSIKTLQTRGRGVLVVDDGATNRRTRPGENSAGEKKKTTDREVRGKKAGLLKKRPVRVWRERNVVGKRCAQKTRGKGNEGHGPKFAGISGWLGGGEIKKEGLKVQDVDHEPCWGKTWVPERMASACARNVKKNLVEKKGEGKGSTAKKTTRMRRVGVGQALKKKPPTWKGVKEEK